MQGNVWFPSTVEISEIFTIHANTCEPETRDFRYIVERISQVSSLIMHPRWYQNLKNIRLLIIRARRVRLSLLNPSLCGRCYVLLSPTFSTLNRPVHHLITYLCPPLARDYQSIVGSVDWMRKKSLGPGWISMVELSPDVQRVLLLRRPPRGPPRISTILKRLYFCVASEHEFAIHVHLQSSYLKSVKHGYRVGLGNAPNVAHCVL